jgi:hypothetical protein
MPKLSGTGTADPQIIFDQTDNILRKMDRFRKWQFAQNTLLIAGCKYLIQRTLEFAIRPPTITRFWAIVR